MIVASCDIVRDALPDALAGRLGPEDTRTVLAHLAGCADCQAEAELIRALRLQPVRAPQGLEQRMRAALAAHRGWSFGGQRAALLAAVLGGLLLGGYLLRQQAADAPRPTASVPATEPTTAPAPVVPAAPERSVSAPAPSAEMPVTGRSLMQALPGTTEASLYSSSATLDDLSEEQLRTLLKELES